MDRSMAKKKLASQSHFYNQLPGVVLNRHDLEDLCELVGKEVSLSTSDYSYDTLDEVKEDRGDFLTDLYLSRRRSGPSDFKRVSVGLGNGVEISCDEDEPTYLKLLDFFSRKRRFVSRFRYVVYAAVWIGLIVLINISTRLAPEPWRAIVSLALTVVIALAITSHFVAYGNRCHIYLVKAHERNKQSWWGRNKDSIVVGSLNSMISALIGALIGGLIGWFARDHFLKP
jgi:hypothetical protein